MSQSCVVSADGTTIGFERSGDGPPVILMGGALNDRFTTAELAEQLAPRFTVLNYDRRGRGLSSDTAPYSIAREIEDLDAVISAAGGSAAVFANCTGGMLALEAVGQGLAISKLAMYEPPYIVDDLQPRLGPEYRQRLDELLADGKPGDAVVHFMTKAVGLPAEFAAKRRSSSFWPSIEVLAPTLPYDAVIVGDSSLPTDLIARITIPTLVLDGGSSPAWQRNSAKAFAEALPNARYCTLEGQNHKLVAEAVLPVLTEFLLD